MAVLTPPQVKVNYPCEDSDFFPCLLVSCYGSLKWPILSRHSFEMVIALCPPAEAFYLRLKVSIFTESSIAEMKSTNSPRGLLGVVVNETILTSIPWFLDPTSSFLRTQILYTVPWRLAPHPLQISSLNWQLSYTSTILHCSAKPAAPGWYVVR